MKPRLLITGGSSSLGREIVRQAIPRWELMATYWSNPDAIPLSPEQRFQLDLRDGAATTACLAHFRPAAIIHTAGSNRSPDFYRVITEGARHIAQAAARQGARLVHLSTDVIFDGQHAPYTEAASPAPIHAYGRAKARAEAIVIQSRANVVSVRTSLIYSLTGDDHTTHWLLEAIASKQPATLFSDEFRCPIWVQSLAAACLELAQHPHQGILNVAGAQRVDRWELGSKLLAAVGVKMGAAIRPGRTPATLRHKRPGNCTLDISLAQELLQTPLPGLDQVLARFAPRPKASPPSVPPWRVAARRGEALLSPPKYGKDTKISPTPRLAKTKRS